MTERRVGTCSRRVIPGKKVRSLKGLLQHTTRNKSQILYTVVQAHSLINQLNVLTLLSIMITLMIKKKNSNRAITKET